MPKRKGSTKKDRPRARKKPEQNSDRPAYTSCGKPGELLHG